MSSPSSLFDQQSLSSSDSEGNPEQALFLDPFEIDSEDDSSEDENLRQNTLENSGPARFTVSSKRNLPSNPFQKTLADHTEVASLTLHDNKQAIGFSTAADHNPRPLYNVDEFTKLLLTGSKPPSRLNEIQQHPSSEISHDVPEPSQQPVSEPLHTERQVIIQESHPVFLHQDIDATSEDKNPKEGGNPRPPPPKSHHGMAINENLHQPSFFGNANLVSRQNPLTVPSTSMMRINTNLDKPLPPPPSLKEPLRSDYQVEGVHNVENDSVHIEPRPSGIQSPCQQANLSALPFLQGHSQLKPNAQEDSGKSGSSTGSDPTGFDPWLTNHTSSSLKPTPPVPLPPPRRIRERTRDVSTSSANSVTSNLSIPSIHSPKDSPASRAGRTRPPLPLARTTSMSSSRRSAGIISSNTSSPSKGPPPMPPPRRRGSSQSSLTASSSRQSEEFHTTPSTEGRNVGSANTTFTPLPLPAATHKGQLGKDILADLQTLQREVDELRGKFRD